MLHLLLYSTDAYVILMFVLLVKWQHAGGTYLFASVQSVVLIVALIVALSAWLLQYQALFHMLTTGTVILA